MLAPRTLLLVRLSTLSVATLCLALLWDATLYPLVLHCAVLMFGALVPTWLDQQGYFGSKWSYHRQTTWRAFILVGLMLANGPGTPLLAMRFETLPMTLLPSIFLTAGMMFVAWKHVPLAALAEKSYSPRLRLFMDWTGRLYLTFGLSCLLFMHPQAAAWSYNSAAVLAMTLIYTLVWRHLNWSQFDASRPMSMEQSATVWRNLLQEAKTPAAFWSCFDNYCCQHVANMASLRPRVLAMVPANMLLSYFDRWPQAYPIEPPVANAIVQDIVRALCDKEPEAAMIWSVFGPDHAECAKQLRLRKTQIETSGVDTLPLPA